MEPPRKRGKTRTNTEEWRRWRLTEEKRREWNRRGRRGRRRGEERMKGRGEKLTGMVNIAVFAAFHSFIWRGCARRRNCSGFAGIGNLTFCVMGGKSGKMWQHGFAVFAGCACHDDDKGDAGEGTEGRDVGNHDDRLPGRRDASRATRLSECIIEHYFCPCKEREGGMGKWGQGRQRANRHANQSRGEAVCPSPRARDSQ